MLQLVPRAVVHKSLRVAVANANATAQRNIPPTYAKAQFASCASHFQSYHTMLPISQIQNKDSDIISPQKEDAVPVWQNPLHHNKQEMKKMFEEDFEEREEISPAPLPPFETDPHKVVAPPHIHDLAHEIVNLTLLELKQLTEKIAQHFDFDDQVMASSYSGGSSAIASMTTLHEEQQEEKVVFDLKLIGFDAKAKIKVIKEVRAIAGLGLKEAKELVEAAPKVFHKGLKQDKAEELKAQLEAVGAQVEIV